MGSLSPQNIYCDWAFFLSYTEIFPNDLPYLHVLPRPPKYMQQLCQLLQLAPSCSEMAVSNNLRKGLKKSEMGKGGNIRKYEASLSPHIERNLNEVEIKEKSCNQKAIVYFLGHFLVGQFSPDDVRSCHG